MNTLNRQRIRLLCLWVLSSCLAFIILFGSVTIAKGDNITNKFDVTIRIVKNLITHQYEPQANFLERSNATYYLWYDTDGTFTNWIPLYPFPETSDTDRIRIVGLPPNIYGPVNFIRALEIIPQ